MAFLDTLAALGPVALWRRDEQPGATVMADSVGTLDGVYGGSVQLGQPGITDDPGITAVGFDNVSSYANTPFPADWATYPGFSLVVTAAVVKPPVGAGSYYVAITNGLDMWVGEAGDVGGYVKGEVNDFYFGTYDPLPFDEPALWVVTWDGATITLQLNETVIGTGADTLWRGNTTDPMYYSSYDTFPYGEMVQGPAAWFNRALTPAEITSLVAGVGSAPVDTSIGTSTEFNNDAYIIGGRARVWYDQPIVPAPAGVRRQKVQQVHQSLPAPNLVDGRPT